MTVDEMKGLIGQEFRERANVRVVDIDVRAYPEETNYVVYVAPTDFATAAEVGNDLDELVSTPSHRAFIVVRRASEEQETKRSPQPLTTGVQDTRVTDLVKLISARSRVSQVQPSLSYVRDVKSSISAVTSERHHLVFGRRGAGKTALLVEAKRQLDREGALTCWVNVQTYRHEPADRVFLYTIEQVLSSVITRQIDLGRETAVTAMAHDLYAQVQAIVNVSDSPQKEAVRIIPRVNQLLKRFLEQSATQLFVFLDDYYYLPRQDQPRVLDMLNSCIRDTEAWLKVASIRNLTRWFQASPPMGLETIQDANIIDLDVTLQDPGRAQYFLERILQEYARRVNISSLARIFNSKALDRLVLASGGVPRDYLVLASDSIARAQTRTSARLVGAQDVNQAAGDAADVKIRELEDDMAANVGVAEQTVAALTRMRRFCTEDEGYTYFLVDLRQKEENPKAYSVLTNLMDVRFVHIIDASVSDPHNAGQRSEAFMLDLSQFSGSRLKQGIHILEFQGGRMVARKTASKNTKDRVGNTPREVIAILRVAPKFNLDKLSDLVMEPRPEARAVEG